MSDEKPYHVADALHVHGQATSHDPVFIVGARDQLERLRSTIGASIWGEPTSSDFFTADGEGYRVVVIPVEDTRDAALPYIEPPAPGLAWEGRSPFQRLGGERYRSLLTGAATAPEQKGPPIDPREEIAKPKGHRRMLAKQETMTDRIPPHCAEAKRNDLTRLDLMEALQRAHLWNEAGAFNQTEDEEILYAALRTLRSWGGANSMAAVAEIEAICAEKGIVLPPAAGGCWAPPKPTAIGGGKARCA